MSKLCGGIGMDMGEVIVSCGRCRYGYERGGRESVRSRESDVRYEKT